MTFYVDGNAFFTLNKGDVEAQHGPWVYDHPFYIILNNAVGGDWPGAPDATSVFPQNMSIDYVRVSSLTPGSGSGGQITGLAGKCVDVAGANSADGTTVQLYDCNGTAAQQWSRPGDGTIRASSR